MLAHVHLGEKGNGLWAIDGTADHIQLACYAMKDA